ncbi:C40 family peptidase [Streptomyces sp. NPDC052101]|uniref:C40 family peptidase n=1 Tax=Streptomyces sp. NPDC052101 TaxID=3155763 RepID=UPI00343DECAC
MAPESRDEGPQRDEVRQRVNSLYDQAENATGNYNATRAMASVTRSRGVPLAKRSGGRTDPALDEVARQWFDAARSRFGPSVPAVLPADRLPDRPRPPGRSRGRMGGGLPDGERGALLPSPSARRPEALERAVDRVVAELSAGRATDPASLALAARDSARAALPGPRRPELPGGQMELAGIADVGGWEPAELGPVETAALPAPALPGPQSTPVQELTALPGTATPGRRSPAVSKAANQRKLAAASDVISRYAAQLVTAAAAVQPPAVQPAPVAPVPPAPDTTGSPTADTAITAIPAAPAQATSDPWTGQWQQPRWAAPAGTTTTTAPADPWSTTAPATAAPITATPLTAAPVTMTPATMTTVTDTGLLPLITESPEAVRVAKAIAYARAQIGKPCVWGATGPDSYDCSSLTQAAWKAAGVSLPRAAHKQALAGAPVTLAGIEPGDLVLFFDDDRHVGLHVGGGMMVHAPGPGSSIREESIYGAGESAIHRIVRLA